MSLKKFAPWKIQSDDRFKLSDIPTRLAQHTYKYTVETIYHDVSFTLMMIDFNGVSG